MTGPSNAWTTYVIGFKKFSCISPANASDRLLLSKDVPTISKITFGMDDWSGNYKDKYIYVDNIRLDASLSTSDYSATPIS